MVGFRKSKVTTGFCAALLLLALLLVGPQRLVAEAVFRTITIAWNASDSPGISGYRVSYGTKSGQYSETIDVGDQTTCDIPNLIDGTTYFFVVKAYTADNEESPASAELVHTANPGVMLNISTRARVQDGDAVVIAGFIIGGSSRKTIIVRGLGPSLGLSGITDTLADPMIELHGPDGLIAANDNWRDGNLTALSQFHLVPGDEAEAALVVNLNPGTYTAIIRGKAGSSGIGLLEVYDGGIPVSP